MNSFPQELIERISSFLDVDDLKRTLFVSQTFQAAAERYSGAFNTFDFGTADNDCNKFLLTYGGRRLSYLRYIEIHTRFPSLDPWKVDPDVLQCRESLAELLEKNKMFTRQIRRVFEAIKEAEGRAGRLGCGPGRIHLVLLTPVRWVARTFCWHHLSSAWRIHLLCPEELPDLLSVRGLSVCNPENRHTLYGDHCALSRLELRVIVDLASKLPNLEYLLAQLGIEEQTHMQEEPGFKHFQHDYEACARDSRFGFAQALEKAVLSPSLRSVQMDFLNEYHHNKADEYGGGPDLVGPAPYDFFSTSLHTFSSSIRILDLRLKADSTLFLSSSGDTFFPNLERLHVMFHPTAPSGSWYFRGCNGEGAKDVGYRVTDSMYPPLEDNPSDAAWHFKYVAQYGLVVHRFRVVPNEQTLYPFLEAFAKAASNMRALKEAALYTHTDNHRAWGVYYYKPGGYWGDDGKVDKPSRRLFWSVGQWRPPVTMHGLFQDIGRAEHGEELLESWNALNSYHAPSEPDHIHDFETSWRFLSEGYHPPGRLTKEAEHPETYKLEFMDQC